MAGAMTEQMKLGDAVLVRAKVERVDHEGGVLYVDAHSDQYGWARPESLTTEAAIRADERRRVERSGYASDEAEWVDIACRCCKSKPLMRTWKFCPTCGSDVRAEREGGAG